LNEGEEIIGHDALDVTRGAGLKHAVASMFT